MSKRTGNVRVSALLVLSLALWAALALGCADEKPAVRDATSAAIDALAAGEAFTSNDSYALLPDERLSGLYGTHEPIYKVCQTALGRMRYELGEVAVSGDAATVEVTVTAPDLFAALERAQADVRAYVATEEGRREVEVREDINQRMRYLCDWMLVYLSEHLADEDVEQLTLCATAHLARDASGTWLLDYAENPELLAALFCVR